VRLPSEGTRVRFTEAWPLASVVVVEALTVPKAFAGFTKSQETVAPGSGFPVASFTRTTAGLRLTAALAQIVQMSWPLPETIEMLCALAELKPKNRAHVAARTMALIFVMITPWFKN
jgi:hypothetical protein